MGKHPQEVSFTIEDIEQHWKEYSGKKALRVLKDGKWIAKYPVTQQTVDENVGTRREMVLLKQVISFPTYLKKYAGA